MLLELHIKNFALIDRVDLEFSEGLNMLTGETGAGKSILIDSVNFLLGEKQNREIIRTGEESAYVEGVFLSENSELDLLLQENGIDMEDVLVITREINQSGRSMSRINGRTVTVGVLRQISKYLIDIHGQHEHQSLLHEESHIDILDAFCGQEFSDIKRGFRDRYHELRRVDAEIDKLRSDEQFKLRRMDLLSFQIQEISEANLKNGEEEELTKRKSILSNSEKIVSNLSSAYQELYEGGDEKESAYDLIGTSIAHIETLQRYDERLGKMRSSLEDVYYQLKDVIDEVRDYLDGIEFDENELNEIEARLDLISKLKRKYGSDIPSILEYLQKIKNELSQMERSEEAIEELTAKRETINKELQKIAETMTETRKSTSEKLEDSIEGELRYLGMERAVFKVEINQRLDFTESGHDEVFFTMTANPGEPLKPLSKVASGGEMSRIMLAIKSVIADVDKIPTLIFDEIDTGISGRTAQSVAEKMVLISRSHQILCVTHLPQIASMSDAHFKIQKFIKEEKTITMVYRMDKLEQINELARMLGGALVTELTRNHSREMLDLAVELKKRIRS